MRYIILTLSLLLAVGCGSSSGGGDSDAPRLRDVSFTLTANANLRAICQAQGFSTGWVARGQYSGDVVGGELVWVGTFDPSGASGSGNTRIPSADLGIAGDTFEFRACLSPGLNDALDVEIWALSPGGRESNHVRGRIAF